MNNNFNKRLDYAKSCAAFAGTAGAAIGAPIVAGVCSVGGSFFGPVGTFFGLEVGVGAGSIIGSAAGTATGFLYGCIAYKDAYPQVMVA